MAGASKAAPVALHARLVPFHRQVQRHLLAMVKDPALAEELTQDTYTRALARIDQLRDPQAALAWLYRIATTVALDRLRQKPPIPLDDTDLAAEVDHAAEAERPYSLVGGSLERSEMSDCVDGYLAALPDDYRIAILLHDAHGLTSPEIADLVGCSLPTAKIRLHRARQRLRESLTNACDFDIDERGVLVCERQPRTIPDRWRRRHSGGSAERAPRSTPRRRLTSRRRAPTALPAGRSPPPSAITGSRLTTSSRASSKRGRGIRRGRRRCSGRRRRRRASAQRGRQLDPRLSTAGYRVRFIGLGSAGDRWRPKSAGFRVFPDGSRAGANLYVTIITSRFSSGSGKWLAVLGAAVLLAASAAASAGAAASGATRTMQTIAITIVAGDRVAQAANFALAPGAPVRLTVTNDTHQFHTFTVPGLHVSELILPGRTTSFAFIPTGWGAFAWHCIICPSGMHGHPHTMGGTLYLIIAPSALG